MLIIDTNCVHSACLTHMSFGGLLQAAEFDNLFNLIN